MTTNKQKHLPLLGTRSAGTANLLMLMHYFYEFLISVKANQLAAVIT